MSKKKPKGHGNLTYYIIAAIVAAIAMGYFAPEIAVKFEVGGEVFLSLLMMMVVPLVVMSVMSGILGLGDVRKLGKPGAYAIGYYMSTTVLAVIVGLILVNIMKPGVNKELEAAKAKYEAAAGPEKKKAEAELVALKEKIKAKVEEKNESNEEAAKAVEEQKKRKEAIEAHKKAEENLSVAAKALADAKAALKEAPHDETLKTQVETAMVDRDTAEKAYAKAVAQKKKAGEEKDLGDILENILLMLVTNNLFKAAAEMNLLPLIVFSIIFAAMLTTMGKKVFAITRMIGQANDALMSFVMLLMNIAPFGIFCLVAGKFGHANLEGKLAEMAGQQGYYILTIITGLGFHAFVTLFLIYWLFTKKNPITFFKNMSQAVLTAFSTASSSATLPITMECAIDKAGISEKSTKFVLPLGATINMDGTALYEAAAAIFIAQIYFPITGQELTMTTQVTIAITATLAAIGAAGIPEAGLVTMLIVLNAAGLPVEAIGLILMVDWLLDRFRTAVNCFGDSVGAAIVDGVMEQDDELLTEDPKPEGATA
jgi:solute carrier family 1 (neuronal/epithelial high affinity glutamate transporter), member 1